MIMYRDWYRIFLVKRSDWDFTGISLSYIFYKSIYTVNLKWFNSLTPSRTLSGSGLEAIDDKSPFDTPMALPLDSSIADAKFIKCLNLK